MDCASENKHIILNNIININHIFKKILKNYANFL